MIETSVTGAREVVADLRRFDAAARGEIQKGIGRIVLKLLVKVKQEKLSGPGQDQVLNVVTGRLRRSITQRIEAGAGEINGIVGTNVEYAKFHEFGQSIKADLKKRRQGFKAGLNAGKPSLNADDLPPRSFLRSALAELKKEGAIDTEIDAAIARATKAS